MRRSSWKTRPFPACSNGRNLLCLRDEIYQIRNYSRDNVRVLMRLDASKLDLKNKNVHRTDSDFAVTWAKMYGKGRVFYSTLGHVEENWDKPEFQKMLIGGHPMGHRNGQCGSDAATIAQPLAITKLKPADTQTVMTTPDKRASSAISRRTFNWTAGAALLAGALPLHASSKLNVGIGTYSYHNLSLDDMITQLKCVAHFRDRNVARRVHADEPSRR